MLLIAFLCLPHLLPGRSQDTMQALFSSLVDIQRTGSINLLSDTEGEKQ